MRAACFAMVACAAETHGHPAPIVPRAPPDSIDIRTDRFTFHMGARVDPTWPAKAEQTRDALGGELAALMDQEDTTVPILARQLGVTLPDETTDFDVALLPGAPSGADTPCDAQLVGALHVRDRRLVPAQPAVFFACVLRRTFSKLMEKSGVHRAIVLAHAPIDEVGKREADHLYGCIMQFAVATVVSARDEDKDEAKRVLGGLPDACTPSELDWVSHTWVKRVREDESAMDYGSHAAKDAWSMKGP